MEGVIDMNGLTTIISGEENNYDDIKDLVRDVICKNYYELNEKEKKNELEKRTVANTIEDNIEIVNLYDTKQNYKEDAFILYDEITYILSLAKFNKIVLVEKAEFNYFSKYIKSIGIEPSKYIIINKFADEIMKNYLMHE